MTDQISTRMTAEAFRQLPESTQPTELIDGAVLMSPSPIASHQRLVGRFYALLRDLSPPGEPFIAPMDVYLDDENVFQPDVFWLADDSQCDERDGYFYGAPELVVEVHSPATMKLDKQHKFTIYEQHGVIDYWMVDPVGRIVEIWQRDDDTFMRLGVYGNGDTFSSRALGHEVMLDDIFPEQD